MVCIEWGLVSKGNGFVYWKMKCCRKGVMSWVIERTLGIAAVLHWKGVGGMLDNVVVLNRDFYKTMTLSG